MQKTKRNTKWNCLKGIVAENMRDISRQLILSLHQYFIWANRMRTHFDEKLLESSKDHDPQKLDIETMMYLSLWYATLYTVIEGWRELKLHDSKIDFLLHSPNVDYLKKYRNGALHFQRDYFDQRFQGMFSSEDSVSWVRELNSELGRYFLDWNEKRMKNQEEEREDTEKS